MPLKRSQHPSHGEFAALPVRQVTVGGTDDKLAVHVSGRVTGGVLPLVCVAGYHRNMTDYAGLLKQKALGRDADWPVVLVDFRGRGRSPDRRREGDYGSVPDARDLAQVTMALGIERAIFVGQGHGGQAIMAMAAEHPLLIGGAILIDAGPMTDSRGIVRLRSNLGFIDALRGDAEIRSGLRQILASDYPGSADSVLDTLAARSHVIQNGRASPLFDPALVKRLAAFSHDDVLMAQWPLFDALAHAPMMVIRTQLTDQLRRETFDEMIRRRPDAVGLTIAGQGSPALLDHAEEVDAMGTFARQVQALQGGWR